MILKSKFRSRFLRYCTFLILIFLALALTIETIAGNIHWVSVKYDNVKLPLILPVPKMEIRQATYIIFGADYNKDGIMDEIYAINGQTGNIEFSGINASSVIQDAINALTNGGKIFIKAGSYKLTSKLLISKRHIAIEGEPNTILFGKLMPIFEVDGQGMDRDENVILNDIQLKNLIFYYTGDVVDGSFVYIHEIQNDKNYQGDVSLTNIVIRSNQTSVPTNVNFVGLCLEDVIGIGLKYVNVAYFGTGIQVTSTIWEGSHNVYERCMISYCKYGVWYKNAGYTCETWIAPKIMHIHGGCGFLANSYNKPQQLILISPQFESLPGVWAAIDVQPVVLTVLNGMFSHISNIGIKVHGDIFRANHSAIIKNCHFYVVNTAIKTGAEYTELGGNFYSTKVKNKVVVLNGVKVTGNDLGYVMKNYGVTTIPAGSTSISFNHGLISTPTVVTLGAKENIGALWWSANSTHITIYCETAPANDTEVSWYARV